MKQFDGFGRYANPLFGVEHHSVPQSVDVFEGHQHHSRGGVSVRGDAEEEILLHFPLALDLIVTQPGSIVGLERVLDTNTLRQVVMILPGVEGIGR